MDQSCGTSMTGFVDKFGVYIQYIENVICDTLKRLVGREEEADGWSWSAPEMYYFHWKFLNSAKNCLSSQYKDIYITLLVERIDDMKLSHKLFDNKFQASPESVFELPRVKKLLTQIMHKWWVLFYQGKKLSTRKRFYQK